MTAAASVPPKIDRPLNVIVATDCGSTTTKAILIEKVGGEYRQTYRGEAPTTMEAPFEDVTRGVLNAIAEIEELSKRNILDVDQIITPCRDAQTGVDMFISTSRAGGGLQMTVTGVVQNMTGESAQRAALGAGAIVIDVLASNDGRLPHEKIERIRSMRPDMILMSGGTDGGAVTHVVEMAEYIAAADPRPRFGVTYKLPLIYAGNKDAQSQVKKILGDKTALEITDNIRPVLEKEYLAPARNKIHDLFLEHVMQQAPGYKKLIDMAGAPIMPTPAAVGLIMETIARREHLNLIGVDIGGATTDVFSVFDGVFNRTVSANLGMSYSISNVLAEAKLANIMRWVPFTIDEQTLRNRIKNKMIRPTTIPQTLDELQIEHAIARDALRRIQSMLMMVDAYEPVGCTMLSVDSIFMMPHLGVLSTIDEKAATDVFVRDCMIYLGTCVAPIGQGKDGDTCADYAITFADGRTVKDRLFFGDLRHYPLESGAKAAMTMHPAKSIDAGAGPGAPVTREVLGGVVGVLLDGRGRPLQLPAEPSARVAALNKWFDAVDLYPKG